MVMEKKFCPTCGVDTWQNPMAKAANAAPTFRCVKCAQPYGTGPKRERHEMAAKQALKKVGD